MVDFPDPDGPTMAVEQPDLILNVAPWKTSRTDSGAVGYLKQTFENWMPSWILISVTDLFKSSGALIRGFLSITVTTSLPTMSALKMTGMCC